MLFSDMPTSARAPGPRILHLFANYKWTGPADPAIRTAAWSRRLGARVVFGQAGWTLPQAEHRMAAELWRSGLPVWTGLDLRKHGVVPSILADVRRLRKRLLRDPVDVIHCHLDADHLIAALALRRMADPPLLVRSLYDPTVPSPTLRRRWAFRRVDGVVAPTRAAAEGVERRFRVSGERILYQDPPTEPGRREACGGREAALAVRARLGIATDDVVVGITARIQPHRRFDLLWETARWVADRAPEVKWMLLGRGNDRDTQRHVREPVARLELESRVLWPGYLYEPQYTQALCALDVFFFLVPGSDGTCRAVREAMGLGLPVVATRRGVLPELLGDARLDEGPRGAILPGGGIVCDETPEAMGQAVLELARDPARRESLGAAAAHRAEHSMDPGRAARRLADFYRRLRGDRTWSTA